MSAELTAQEPSAKYLVNLQPPLVRHFDLIAQAPGGVARLRELILTLAVQGKLVPQDPSDEPASELLKKIRAEKDRLIAEGKIKRDKPLAEIADEEKPFELPEGWEWVRLNALLQKIGAGSTPLGGKEVYVSTGVKFLRSQNVWNEGLRLEGVAYIPPATHAKMSGTVVVANDLLFNITGASIGRCAVVPSYFDEANVSQHVTILRTVIPALNAFLHKVLVSRHVQQTVMDVQVGVSREGLSIAKLGQFLIPVPPLVEQSRIVTRVEELMQFCDALEAQGQLEAEQHARLVSTLFGSLLQSDTPEALADNWQRIATHFDLLLDRPEAVDALEQTILQLAVRGLLVPQDPTDEPASVLLQKIRAEKDHLIAQGKIKRDKPLPPITDEEKPFELPQGWEWARLPDIYFSISPSSNKLLSSAMLAEGKFPVVDQGQKHIAGYTNDEGMMIRVPGPVIVFGDHTKAIKFIDFDFVAGADGTKILRPLCQDERFFAFQLRSFSLEDRGYARHFKVLNSCLFALPPRQEQSRIVTRVTELQALCVELRMRLAASQLAQSHLADALVAQ